jgi:hypothetical protein
MEWRPIAHIAIQSQRTDSGNVRSRRPENAGNFPTSGNPFAIGNACGTKDPEGAGTFRRRAVMEWRPTARFAIQTAEYQHRGPIAEMSEADDPKARAISGQYGSAPSEVPEGRHRQARQSGTRRRIAQCLPGRSWSEGKENRAHMGRIQK